ncbi:hypothetical protein VR010_14600 [Actinomycetaceae bacterium L2_0104]
MEFKKFLTKFGKSVTEHLEVHVICDNYSIEKHPSVKARLQKHPGSTHPLSWINQDERLFAEVTRDLLQRSDQRGVQVLERDLRGCIKVWSKNPQPFIWTKTAEDILNSIIRDT